MRPILLLSILVACNQTGERSPAADPGSPAAASAEAAAPAPAAATADPAKGAEPGEKVPEFEVEGLVLSADGEKPQKIASRDRERPTAYVFIGARCGTTAKYLGRLAALEKTYAGKLDFVYLYPNRTDSTPEKKEFHRRHGLGGPLIEDRGAKIAALLGRERTAEVVVVGADGVIAYAGAIDDNKDESKVTRKHLAIAIDEHLAGKPVSEPKTLGTA